MVYLLRQVMYKHGDERTKARAVLCSIFFRVVRIWGVTAAGDLQARRRAHQGARNAVLHLLQGHPRPVLRGARHDAHVAPAGRLGRLCCSVPSTCSDTTIMAVWSFLASWCDKHNQGILGQIFFSACRQAGFRAVLANALSACKHCYSATTAVTSSCTFCMPPAPLGHTRVSVRAR